MFNVPEKYRVLRGPFASTLAAGNNGVFVLPSIGGGVRVHLQCIASDSKHPDANMFGDPKDGIYYEHVSIVMINITHSGKTHELGRCPTWAEMCYVKETFWDDPEDVVIQYHPPKSEYVSNHQNCLHLWRPADKEGNPIPIPRPDPRAVGLMPKPKEETPTK